MTQQLDFNLDAPTAGSLEHEVAGYSGAVKRGGPIKEIAFDPPNLHWLAGLLEGEGCFSVVRRPNGKLNYPNIKLCMTDLDIVRRVAFLFNRNVIKLKPSATNRKQPYQTHVSGVPSVHLMRALYPLMGLRRRSRIAEILNDFADYSPLTAEQRSENGRRATIAITPEQRSENARHANRVKKAKRENAKLLQTPTTTG